MANLRRDGLRESVPALHDLPSIRPLTPRHNPTPKSGKSWACWGRCGYLRTAACAGCERGLGSRGGAARSAALMRAHRSCSARHLFTKVRSHSHPLLRQVLPVPYLAVFPRLEELVVTAASHHSLLNCAL